MEKIEWLEEQLADQGSESGQIDYSDIVDPWSGHGNQCSQHVDQGSDFGQPYLRSDRTSRAQGRVNIAWVKAFMEGLGEKRPLSLLGLGPDQRQAKFDWVWRKP